jgi:hypothetical protein
VGARYESVFKRDACTCWDSGWEWIGAGIELVLKSVVWEEGLVIGRSLENLGYEFAFPGKANGARFKCGRI